MTAIQRRLLLRSSERLTRWCRVASLILTSKNHRVEQEASESVSATLSQRFGDSLTQTLRDYSELGELSAHLWPHLQVIARLKQTIEANTPPGQKVVLISHDWGAFTAYLFANAHPELLEALVTLDVGMVTPWRLPLRHAAVIISYQLWLVCCFLVSQLVSVCAALFSVLPQSYTVTQQREKRRLTVGFPRRFNDGILPVVLDWASTL